MGRRAERPGEPVSGAAAAAAGAPGTLDLLRRGEVEVKGRLPWSSNGTFLVDVCLDGEETLAVYKPLRGERPLWDYPPGLYRREVAVYLVSEALGWGLVPETVVRVDGPLGEGSLQRFVPSHFEEHYFTMLERPELHDALRTICLFDLVVNNGDRKSGHCLRGDDGRIWAIDHGLCLHDEPKLRTVIWDFAGQPLPPHRLDDVARLAASPPPGLETLLEPAEVDALAARAAAVLRRPVFPAIRSARAYPWPLV
ncbi:MAG TPA: SCO1664 family protein [Acidimicrobiales bacterium]|nr:SCO1664 family protein [Acidimicrobiales bacterium]